MAWFIYGQSIRRATCCTTFRGKNYFGRIFSFNRFSAVIRFFRCVEEMGRLLDLSFSNGFINVMWLSWSRLELHWTHLTPLLALVPQKRNIKFQFLCRNSVPLSTLRSFCTWNNKRRLFRRFCVMNCVTTETAFSNKLCIFHFSKIYLIF